MAKDKRPAMQLYIGDWKKDPNVRACSIAARGLWFEMICAMFECEPRGYMLVGSKQATVPQIAKMSGCDVAETESLLKELEDARVFSRTDDGTIYSRRMVRDEQLRSKRQECGKMGGNPNLVNQMVNHVVNQEVNHPLNPDLIQSVEDEDEDRKPSSLSSGSKGLEPFEADQPAKLGPGMPGFTQFMNAYPRHRLDGDGTNRRLWVGMNCEPNAAAILAGLEAHKASGKWQEAHGQFVPKASNFLKNETWNCPPMEATNGPDHRNQSHRRPSPEDARRAADRAQRVGGGEVGPIPILGRRGAG
jgi:hypothetical protein